LQYPFVFGGSGATLDVTIHEMRIITRPVPEPAMLHAAMAMALAIGLNGRRRRRGF
jgi:hypothetical protein